MGSSLVVVSMDFSTVTNAKYRVDGQEDYKLVSNKKGKKKAKQSKHSLNTRSTRSSNPSSNINND